MEKIVSVVKDKNAGILRILSVYLYLFLVLLSVLSVCYLSFSDPYKSEELSAFSSVEFVDSLTENVISDTLIEIPAHTTYQFKLSPAMINNSLCFKARHLFVTISVGDEVLYKTYQISDPLYTKSTGVTWITLPLKSEYLKYDYLTIDCVPYYQHTAGLIDNLCVADSWSFMRTVLLSRISYVFVFALSFICGILCLCIQIPISIHHLSNRDFLYLGFMSVFMSLYSLCESQLLELFVHNTQLIHLMSYLSLSMLPVFLVFYAGEFYETVHHKIKNILVFVSMCSFLFAFVLNSIDFGDFHELSLCIFIPLFFSIVYVFSCLVYYIIRLNKDKSQISNFEKLSVFVQSLGFLILCICAVIDIFRFYFSDAFSETLVFVKSSVAVFIFSYMFVSSLKLATMLKGVTKSDFVSKLAYEDGLTGLQNRTAFNERLEKTDKSCGIIMFDVNNLKVVNDTYGHAAGDTLLISAAKALADVFSSLMLDVNLYRIGGDEFVAVVEDDKAAFDSCCDWVKEMLPVSSEKYSDEENHIVISIAFGGSYYDSNSKVSTLQYVFEQADHNMYLCKRFMKKNAITKELINS